MRGTFTGLTLDSDQGAMWRCVLEGIGYDYMEVTDRYRAAGIDLTTLTITEGGSRDDLWNQIKADMLDTQVSTLRVAGGRRADKLHRSRLRSRRYCRPQAGSPAAARRSQDLYAE